MIGARIEITGILKVLSPLHIGTGKPEPAGEATVAAVQLDHNDAPCLPGSSIKGVLSRVLGRPSRLFGYAPGSQVDDDGDDDADEDSQQTGRAGDAIFWTALITKAKDGADPIGIERRTAIDAEAGVARKARLFQARFVRPGTRFELRVTLRDGAHGSADDLAAVLKALCSEDGVAFGRNSGKGYGRVQLEHGSVMARRICPVDGTLDVGERWTARIANAQALPGAGERYRLSLVCDGPFAVLDQEERERSNLLRALGDFGKVTPRQEDAPRQEIATRQEDAPSQEIAPRLPGSTLIGALRSQFAWFDATRKDPDDDSGKDNKDQVFDARKHQVKRLRPVERLFGVTGWRGRVSIERIAQTGKPERKTVTSLRLDRFSGAPIDGALFETQIWCGAAFDVVLRLEARPGDDDARACFSKDDALFEKFVKSLTHDVWGGLDLGHGINKGFGWFRVERVS